MEKEKKKECPHIASDVINKNQTDNAHLCLQLEQLSFNLDRIREDGFMKIGQYVRDLREEKHSYQQKLNKIYQVIDERVSEMKSHIDDVHMIIQDQLNEMKNEMSQKINYDIEVYKNHVSDMNYLTEKGVELLRKNQKDLQPLTQLNMEIEKKLMSLHKLKNETAVLFPHFEISQYTKENIERLIGTIQNQTENTTQKGQLFSADSRKSIDCVYIKPIQSKDP